MASIGILFLICTVIFTSEANEQSAFVSLKCEAENVGQNGHQSMLECIVQTTQEAAKATIRTVTWKKDGAENALLVFHEGETKLQPGYKFAEPSWNAKNMNVSLLITNTAVTDAGDYKCTVMTNSGNSQKHTTLKVTAKFSVPTIRSIPDNSTPNADKALVCESDGGYPEGRIRWFVGDTEWTQGFTPEVKKLDSGLFHLSSKLPLLRGSIFPKYTCVVFNASGGKESEIVYEEADKPKEPERTTGSESASKIVAPVVVIGSLIVGLLLALLIYRKRTQNGHQEVCTYEPDVEQGSPK